MFGIFNLYAPKVVGIERIIIINARGDIVFPRNTLRRGKRVLYYSPLQCVLFST